MTESQHPHSSRRWRPWAAAGVTLAVGGVVGGCTSTSTSTVTSSVGSPGASTVSACAVTSVADKVIPSVVTIAASGSGGHAGRAAVT